MDRCATKDHYERETDEAERLVRPAPKVKPKRTDLRREQTRPDGDPDIDSDPDTKRDPDMSLNYKTVGGSASARVLSRFIVADLERSSQNKDRVKVRHRQTGNITYVLPDTLKEDGGVTYEAVESEEEPSAKPEEGSEKPSAEPEDDESFLRSLYDAAEKDPNFGAAIRQLTDPDDAWAGIPDETPLSQISDLRQHEGLLRRFKTVGDLRKWETSEETLQRVESDRPEKKPVENEPPKNEDTSEDDPDSESEDEEDEDEEDEGSDESDSDTPKLHPDDQKVFEDWVAQKKYEAADFVQWAADQTGVREKGGRVFFRDESRKKMVPFEQLPVSAQVQWKQQFETDSQIGDATTALRTLATQNPKVHRLLRELANPDSGTMQSLMKDQASLKRDPRKAIGGLHEVELPDAINTVEDLIAAAGRIYKRPTEPDKREPSEEERDRAKMHIIENFPPDVAETLLAHNLHPDDVGELVNSYQLAKGTKLKNLDAALDMVGGLYQTDPAKVTQVPRYGVDALGVEMPFEDLTPEDQAVAMQKHRMRTVALSLAAREAVATRLTKKTGVSEELAGHLADFTLQRSPEEPSENRIQRAREKAKELFEQTMLEGLSEPDTSRWGGGEGPAPGKEGDPEPKAPEAQTPPSRMNPTQVQRLFEALGSDPAAQQVAVGYLQAEDLVDARQEYLADGVITEHQSPRKIWTGIQNAQSFFDQRAKRYPAEFRWVNDPSTSFRRRILDRVRTLSPEKFPFLRKWNEQFEDEQYEERVAEWEDQFSETSPYREHAGEDPPKPTPPVGYEARHSDPKSQKTQRRRLLEEHRRQLGLNSNSDEDNHKTVQAYSSYSKGVTMAGNSKTAVYWGLDPHGYEHVEPYTKWTQDGKGDLTDGEILKLASAWLQSSVLESQIEGVSRDLQIRAALDLSLRGHSRIAAARYEQLATRLACGCDSNPHDSVYVPSGEEYPMKASTHIRAFAARVASTDPTLAYELIDLATTVANQEEDAQGEQTQKQAAPVQSGEVPPQFLEHMKKKEDGGGEKKDEAEGQQKQAYHTLRSTVIKTAQANPHLREAYLPLLQMIKQLG